MSHLHYKQRPNMLGIFSYHCVFAVCKLLVSSVAIVMTGGQKGFAIILKRQERRKVLHEHIFIAIALSKAKNF